MTDEFENLHLGEHQGPTRDDVLHALYELKIRECYPADGPATPGESRFAAAIRIAIRAKYGYFNLRPHISDMTTEELEHLVENHRDKL